MDMVVRFRATEAERKLYEEAAHRMEQSLSSWIRHQLRAGYECDLEIGLHAQPEPQQSTPAKIDEDYDEKFARAKERKLHGGKAGGSMYQSTTLTGVPHGPVPKGKR